MIFHTPSTMRSLCIAICFLAGIDRLTTSFSLNNRDLLAHFHQKRMNAAKQPVDQPSSDAIESAAARESFQELRQTWPLWLQQGLRDTGTLRLIIDFLTRVSAAPNFYMDNPNSLPEFCRITGYPAWLTTTICMALNNIKDDEVDVNELPQVDFNVEKYGSQPEQYAEVMIESSRKNDLNIPLVVFVHGGAWGSGFPSMYRLIARPFLKQGYRVANLGYRVYPKADVDGQMEDISRAIHHVSEAHKAKATFVVGHSSGAHICVLASLQGLFPMNVVGLVGMSGVYDIAQHYEYEILRGVDQISPMKPSCCTTAENMRNRSPRYIVNGLEKNTMMNSMPPLLLLHGADDDTALPRESIGMQEALEFNNFTQSELIVLEGVGHADTALQVSLGGKVQDTILEWLNRLQTDCLS
mmetsp:Transcript_17077/g.20853  ORF Transcript_17077/g.20853 Transcript_17077/m.20853 type:complete len:411 (+) Transcript_17077:121-1353(+)